MSAELQPDVHFSHGRKGARGVGVAGSRKVKMAPARLLKKMMEQRRHWEGLQTLQELKLPKRMREACEEVAGEAARKRCKAGGMFPEGLIKQVAAARVAQSRAVTERLSQQETGARPGSARDGAGGS